MSFHDLPINHFLVKKAALDQVNDKTNIITYGEHSKYVYNLEGKLCSGGIQLTLMLGIGAMRLRGFYPCQNRNVLKGLKSKVHQNLKT